MSEAPEPRGDRRRRGLWTAVRLAFALAILAWVFARLPWTDRLTWKREGDVVAELEGRLLGDWKEPAVRFEPLAPGSPDAADPAWPEDARTALVAGEAVDVRRKAPEEDEGFDWQPAMPRVFGELSATSLAWALLALFTSQVIVTTRWRRLLELAGCRNRWFDTFRLTFLGLFFNLVMPGLTGGDLIKGVLAAKENPGRRADAVVSVVVDRLLGIAGLVLLAAVVIVLGGEAFASLRLPVLAFLGAGVLGAGLYAARPLRRLLRIDELVERLPLADKLRSLDSAALLYLRHPLDVAVALALSIVNHVVVVGGVLALGTAFGATIGRLDYLVIVPIANLVSAVPLAPGGWGLGEYAYEVLFDLVGANPAVGVAISVTFRLCLLVLGLAGGVFLLLPGGKAEVRRAEAEVEVRA